MNETLLKNMKLNKAANLQELLNVEKKLNITLPEDYKEFMLKHNGGEGSIGESYVSIWRIEDIVEWNEEYEVKEYTDGLIYFGSDGGDEAYAFDTRIPKITIVMFPFTSIHYEDARFISDNFNDFIINLYNKTYNFEE